MILGGSLGSRIFDLAKGCSTAINDMGMVLHLLDIKGQTLKMAEANMTNKLSCGHILSKTSFAAFCTSSGISGYKCRKLTTTHLLHRLFETPSAVICYH